MRFCLPLVCAATVLQGLSVRTQCCVCQNLTIVSICLPVVSQGQKEQKDALYLTRGWTLDHEGILQQYKMLSETYDEETRNFILQTLYNGYHTLTVLDTGCYDLPPVEQYADTAATFLGFDRKTVPGNITTLEHLITGTQDSNILTLAPGEKIHQMLFEC